jgi:hypothetical protein
MMRLNQLFYVIACCIFLGASTFSSLAYALSWIEYRDNVVDTLDQSLNDFEDCKINDDKYDSTCLLAIMRLENEAIDIYYEQYLTERWGELLPPPKDVGQPALDGNFPGAFVLEQLIVATPFDEFGDPIVLTGNDGSNVAVATASFIGWLL